MAGANHNRLRRGPSAASSSQGRFGVLALFLLAVSACGSAPEMKGAPPSELRVWVGELANSDVAVGIAASSERSTFFFCGGDRSFVDHTHWFIDVGPLTDVMQLEEDTWHVSVTSANERIAGTLVIDGLDDADFEASPVTPGTLAGIYDARVPCGHAGLIVRQPAGGAAPVMQGTCLEADSGDTLVEQVNPVMPVMRGADSGIPAELAVDPSQQFTLRPLSVQGI